MASYSVNERAVAERHVVAAEDDEIGVQRQGKVHRGANVVSTDERAVMDIGEQCDADAVQRGWESWNRQRRFSGAKTMPAIDDAVDGRSAHGADGPCEDALQCSASSKEHRWLL